MDFDVKGKNPVTKKDTLIFINVSFFLHRG